VVVLDEVRVQSVVPKNEVEVVVEFENLMENVAHVGEMLVCSASRNANFFQVGQ
jgi:hypothetical protein